MRAFDQVWFLCVCICGTCVGAIGFVVWHHTGGHFSYPLDDTYIHMALARNLAFHHVWGITPDAFGAASSSPLYTLLLAVLFKYTGAHLITPLLINAVAAVFLLAVLNGALRSEGLGATARFVVLLGVIIFTPLPTLVLSGMEHTLQCLFSFLFIYRICSSQRRLSWDVLLYAFLMCATRYECLFLVAVAGIILLFQRHILVAFALGVAALLPVVAFGLYSMHMGSYFLPNSILLKSGTGDGIKAFISSIFVDKLTLSKQGITGIATQRLLLILPLVYLAFRKVLEPRYRYFLLILTGGVLLHLCLASTGWFYRYEAYLVLNACMITGICFAKYGASVLRLRPLARLFFIFTALYLVLPLGLRSSAAFSKAPRACLNIFEQQYQMGLFLHRYQDTAAVAANDIGAISYLSNIHTLDLWGLGNISVARSKRGHYWTPSFLDSLSRASHVRVAIVYDSWFDTALLHRWTRVGTWTIPDNVICGDETVSWYTLDPAYADTLRGQLQEYGSALPREVKISYPR